MELRGQGKIRPKLAAIANAIYRATGRRLTDLSMSWPIERMLNMIRKIWANDAVPPRWEACRGRVLENVEIIRGLLNILVGHRPNSLDAEETYDFSAR